MATVFPDRFVEMLVHDLRSPLNVLRLSLHVIDEIAGEDRLGLGEDLAMMRQNIDEIERMLAVLVDYNQLPDSGSSLQPVAFDPRRLVRDVVEDYAERHPKATIDLGKLDGPPEVRLDAGLVRIAILRGLENATAASQGRHPIRVDLSGGPSRCLVSISLEGPAKSTVETTELRGDGYQRILGNAAERRGLDLAIATRISDLFGGEARLVVEPEHRTVLILDWPTGLKPED